MDWGRSGSVMVGCGPRRWGFCGLAGGESWAGDGAREERGAAGAAAPWIWDLWRIEALALNSLPAARGGMERVALADFGLKPIESKRLGRSTDLENKSTRGVRFQKLGETIKNRNYELSLVAGRRMRCCC